MFGKALREVAQSPRRSSRASAISFESSVLLGSPQMQSNDVRRTRLISGLLNWDCRIVFTLNFMTIIPLAWLLGIVTEHVSEHTTTILGGLLNATFGNAVEIIMTTLLLIQSKNDENLIHVMKTSLIGSILSNLLFVLGLCFLAGGIRYREQKFNATGATTNGSLLLLAFLSLSLPTMVRGIHTDINLQGLSCIVAIVLSILYILYLIFQLFTHSHLFQDEENDSDEITEPPISLFGSILLLIIITILISFSSNYLVGAIENLVSLTGINYSFVGLILLPIVGNAAEHVTAVTVAIKDKMDLSIGVAVGSSTQIALFVIPYAMLVGFFLGVPIDLDFGMILIAICILSIMIVNLVVADGESNWLEGVLLLACYIVIASAQFYIPEPKLTIEQKSMPQEALTKP